MTNGLEPCGNFEWKGNVASHAHNDERVAYSTAFLVVNLDG